MVIAMANKSKGQRGNTLTPKNRKPMAKRMTIEYPIPKYFIVFIVMAFVYFFMAYFHIWSNIKSTPHAPKTPPMNTPRGTHTMAPGPHSKPAAPPP